MKVSTKGRYALRFMIDLATHKSDGYVSLTEVASRQNISKKYLEQIVPPLLHANYLDTERGTRGGYRLAKEASEYSVGDILRLSEGTLAPVGCLKGDDDSCDRRCDCTTLPIWIGLEKVINDYLDSITIQDVIERNEKLHVQNT